MQKKKSKFFNKVIQRTDGKFDSKIEYSWWCTLKRMQELGFIENLQRQVKYILIPAQYEKMDDNTQLTKPYATKRKSINGRLLERECSYIADFVYTDCATNETIVADAKGIETPEFVIKRKLMLLFYGIQIKILR